MTYYQFIHAVEEKIKKEVKEERKISVHTNIKNNGVKRTGIMISENGINISPTIYLEEYFQQFKRGYPLELIVKDILSLYEKIRFQNSWKEGEKVKVDPKLTGLDEWIEGTVIDIEHNPFKGLVIAIRDNLNRIFFGEQKYFVPLNKDNVCMQ
jgi:hypothetical protein